jgi:AraC family ethanolamine operon transcriptional activator
MSPIAYIRCERLCRVHDELLEGNRTTTSISETATQWGFAHMSQFAKDYRTLFGESPSTTLLAQRQARWVPTQRHRPHAIQGRGSQA